MELTPVRSQSGTLRRSSQETISQTPRSPSRPHPGDRILERLAPVCHGSDTNKLTLVLWSFRNAGIAARMECKMCLPVPMQCAHFLQ